MTGSHGKTRYYRPELDALRFFAFLCVFYFHRQDLFTVSAATEPSSWVLAGSFGVQVFFLLSAFLIVELLLREREVTRTVHVRAFYVRRILRIWPLYFAAFWGLWLLGRFLPNVGPTPGAWLPFTFFLGNWFILRHGWMAGPVDPLWSIAVEEQFYLFVPALAKWGGRRALVLVSSLLLAVSYGVICYFAAHRIGGETAQWCNSFFEFQFFAGGALLAILLRGRTPQWSIFVRLAAAVGAAASWTAAVAWFHAKSYYLPGEALPGVAQAVCGWGLVLLGSALFLLAALGVPARYVPRWLAYLGKISYGLYIFHSLMLHLVFNVGRKPRLHAQAALHLSPHIVSAVGTVLTLALTIAISALSYWGFESPFLRWKDRFTFVKSRPVGTPRIAGE